MRGGGGAKGVRAIACLLGGSGACSEIASGAFLRLDHLWFSNDMMR